MIVARSPGPAWHRLGFWVGALLGVGLASACRGTEHLVFEPIPVMGPTVSPPHDAGTTSPKPPVADAGHPIKKSSVLDDDGGPPPSMSDSGLDPNVTFLWKQTLPGQGTCRAGRYVGKFTCTLGGEGIADPPPMLQGAVAFTLAGSVEDATLTVMLGDVSGPLFSATLNGNLDCVAKTFSGDTTDGLALLGPGAVGDGGVLTLFPTFDAKLDGRFDDQTLTITGAFMMKNDSNQTCDGTFRVSALP